MSLRQLGGPSLVDKGLVKAGGKQRTDSTHVISAVRDLNRLELAGESVRAAAEALAAAAPDWFAAGFDVPGWSARYGRRVDDWRLPTSQTKRDALAIDFATDGFALLDAVYSQAAPVWLRELPAVQVLRVVLVQNYLIRIDAAGKAVVRRRDADTDGIPPAQHRLASPYDTDTRWAAKGDELFWNGYKVHFTETCDPPETPEPGDATKRLETPNIIVNVATTDATVPDAAMTAAVHADLARRALVPAEHYVDAGYPSAHLVATAKTEHGIDLIAPLLADNSAQARAGSGYDRASFTFDFDARQATCPQGKSSTCWTGCTQAGTAAIVVTFAKADCGPCPVRALCTTSKAGRRQLTIPPQAVHEIQARARAAQNTEAWQAKYALRAGIEGTIHQAVQITGIRRTRYRGLPKTRLDHVLCAAALNLIRLDAYWNGHALDHAKASHLNRLGLGLAA